MNNHYLKVAWRYLLRHKGHSIINISGLAIGIACCILIMVYVRSEFSYDKFHSKSDRIYRAWLHEKYDGQEFINTVTPIPMGPVFQANIPEIESYCRVYAFNTLVKYQENKFNEPVNMVDSTFFRIFDFQLIQGDRNSVLNNPNSIVVTEEMARKYFGNEPAIGKNLELELNNEKKVFTVTGIARKAPQESSIKYDMLIPHSNETFLFSEAARTSGWTSVFEETYFLAKQGKTGAQIESKVPEVGRKIAGDQYKPGQYNVLMQPITKIHLDKSLPAGNLPVSDPAYAYILGTIGLLILIIACINFVTLSIGRSATRAMEVGIRKVLGAERSQLIRQYWGEAMLVTGISMLIAIGLALIFLKPFNSIANKDLVLSFNFFNLLFIIALVVVIGIVAGIYPAIILSGFKPVKVLKSRIQTSVNIGFFRKGLITGQFVASIIMIIGTMVIGQQLDYLQNKNLGFEKENVIIVSTNKPRKEALPLAEKFKEELGTNPKVIGSTISLFSFSEPGWVNLGYEDDKKTYRNFRMNAVDADFLKLMDMKLIAGRNFSKDNTADIDGAMIINETMAKEYGWAEPIGKKLPGRYPQTVIGVVQDFHYDNLHNKIQPLALVMRPDSMFRKSNDVMFGFPPQPRINIRLSKGNVKEQIASIEKNWKTVAGNQDFAYQFLDESLNNQYQEDQRLGKIVRFASLLSIFISCMGLFGLVTLAVVRRTKEIGIRKVLGADISSIVMLLSNDFIWLICIASIVAFPIAWWALNNWLLNFSYRLDIHWWVFIIAGIAALLIALATVSLQAIKAALSNPVNSLRTE
jgi:putative ABC transport system permease protein